MNGRLKLPTRFAPIVMSFLLSLLITCLVSLIATVRSVGFTRRIQPVNATVWLNISAGVW